MSKRFTGDGEQRERGKKIEDLLNETLQNRGQPLDRYEITAILEAKGWNDNRAAEEYGAENVFSLASELWELAHKGVVAGSFQKGERLSPLLYLLMVGRSFLRGTVFAFPMAISIFSMLILEYSLWSYEYLSLELATGIAIGTVMSFMVAGGFMQAIARRGFFYIGQSYYNMARKITFKFIKAGFVICLAISAVFMVFNLFFGVFPSRVSNIVLLYFFFLSAIWLSVTVMYVLKKELVFSLLLVAGIGFVFVFFGLLEMNIIFAQAIALSVVSLMSIILSVYFFSAAEKKMERGIVPALPRTSITIYTTLPYFSYGILYFTFLFLDRIVAWSTNNMYMPYIIWFRGTYELGLDLALFALILPMGFVEVVVSELTINLEAYQREFMSRDTHLLSRLYLKLYYKRMVLVVLISIASALLIYWGVGYLGNFLIFAEKFKLINVGKIRMVFIVALLAYAVLSVALMNALILFVVSQPEMALRSIGPALLGNFIVGFALSRWFDYYFAVFGLLAGAIIFLAFSTKYVRKVLGKLDYYLYAAS